MATKKVTYQGRTSTLRVLNKKDLVSLGLDEGSNFSQTEFWEDQPVEIDSAVADLLLSHEEFKGQFKEVEQDAPAAEADSDEVATDKPTSPRSPNKK